MSAVKICNLAKPEVYFWEASSDKVNLWHQASLQLRTALWSSVKQQDLRSRTYVDIILSTKLANCLAGGHFCLQQL